MLSMNEHVQEHTIGLLNSLVDLDLNGSLNGSLFLNYVLENDLTVASTFCSVSVASISGPSGPRLFRAYGWSIGVQPTSLSDRQRCWFNTPNVT